MRLLTEAFLQANSERLTQQGWKTDEQRRCFRKADALLDYIGRIKPSEYKQISWYKKLNEQRVEGIKYCLEQDMPSAKMRGLSLDILKTLLKIGDELLIRAAWLYKNYPALFKAKYAISPQTFQKDAHFYFIKGHVVPERSFPSFNLGENPVLSRDSNFSKKCIEMYNDPLFETPEYQAYANQPIGKKYPYIQWARSQRSGRRFFGENQSLNYVIERLRLLNKVELELNKGLAKIALAKKKKKEGR